MQGERVRILAAWPGPAQVPRESRSSSNPERNVRFGDATVFSGGRATFRHHLDRGRIRHPRIYLHFIKLAIQPGIHFSGDQRRADGYSCGKRHLTCNTRSSLQRPGL